MFSAGRGRAGRKALAWRFALVFLGVVFPLRAAAGGEPVPVHLLGAGSGRFEVVTEPGAEGVRLAELAAAAWQEWRAPMGLPGRLPVAITVRLVPDEKWGWGEIRSRVEAGPAGVVSVWIRGDGDDGAARDRRWLAALAEGALLRKALLVGISSERAVAPAWLAAAAAEAVVVAENPAMFDAWQAEVAGNERVAGLREILFWEKGESDESESVLRAAAYGVWLWLREESGRSDGWPRFVGAILGGESPGAALVREFSRLTPRPTEAREWELAWRVAAGRLVSMRNRPVMDPAESRLWIERVARLVAFDPRTNEERVLPACGEWGSRGEAWLRVERGERARLIEANFLRLHPFYRNAAGSLGRAWTALASGRETAWREAGLDWENDLDAGRELEAASRALLDEASRR
jgi:hypothetical protein